MLIGGPYRGGARPAAGRSAPNARSGRAVAPLHPPPGVLREGGPAPGAFGVLQWQINRGFDAAADTVPVSAIPRLRRPDALTSVLEQMETARALGIT